MADCSPRSAVITRSRCIVASTRSTSLASTAPASSTDGGHQHRGGERVVLGLGDQVGGDVVGVGRAVGEDRDLGRSRLGVDPDDPAHEALGGGDVDVARTGDDVDRLAERLAVHVVGAGRTVGEHPDRLRAADGVHLVDAEERAGGEHDRVGQAALVLLRRRRHGQRADAGRLRGDDVHDDRRRVHRQPARDVQPDATDRDPPLPDLRAGCELDGEVGGPLGTVHLADAPDGLLERRPDLRVEHPDRGSDHVRGHPQVLRADAVEPLGEVTQLRGPMRADGRKDGRDDLGGVLDVDLRTGELLQELTTRQGATAQVDAGDHVPEHRTETCDAA